LQRSFAIDRRSAVSAQALSLTPDRGAVLADAIGGDRVRDAGLVLAGAGLTALGALVSIHVPGSPVPVTAQTLAVVLAGSTLGVRRGLLSQLVYLLLGLVLPIYAGHASGWSVVAGANGGYLVGFVLAAGIVGWAAEHGGDRRARLAVVTFALGQLAVYGVGVPWLKVATGMSWSTAIHEGFVIFILGGVIKAIVAALATPTAWRLQRRVADGDRA
jgi:biotin transport system substrate-specific component